MERPLSDLLVLDLTRALSGPVAARLLADLGADVIKVEPPDGDLTRTILPRLDGMAAYYVQYNAGKRCVSMDLTKPAARELLLRMVERADVVLENFRPDVMGRLGLSYDVLAARNPRVILASISGWGHGNARSRQGAFASAVHAETGITELVARRRGEGDRPRNDPVSHADVYGGLQALVGLLAALHQRERTGRGQAVEVSMAEATLTAHDLASVELSGMEPDVGFRGGQHWSAVYRLRTGRHVSITIDAANDGGFDLLVAASGRTDWRATCASPPPRRARSTAPRSRTRSRSGWPRSTRPTRWRPPSATRTSWPPRCAPCPSWRPPSGRPSGGRSCASRSAPTPTWTCRRRRGASATRPAAWCPTPASAASTTAPCCASCSTWATTSSTGWRPTACCRRACRRGAPPRPEPARRPTPRARRGWLPSPPMGRLDGNVAIITGASSGIGLSMAERFVEEGALVVLAARRAHLGAEIVDRLGAERASFVTTDVADEAQVAALVAHAVERHGRVDTLVNNAGGTEPATVGSVLGIDLDAADRVWAANVRSVVAGMKHVAPVMLAQGSGSIINIASIAGHKAGYSSSTIYSASKAAVLQLTRSVAMELSEAGIRVNSISPGAIATGIFAKALGAAEGEAADATAARIESVFAAGQPIPRAGRPVDIADAAVFLASPESSFISGTDLMIDGALLAGRAWTPQQAGLANLRTLLGAAE